MSETPSFCIPGVTRTGNVHSHSAARPAIASLDAISGLPVIDLKPAMVVFSPPDIKQPGWVSDMMSEYFGRRHGG